MSISIKQAKEMLALFDEENCPKDITRCPTGLSCDTCRIGAFVRWGTKQKEAQNRERHKMELIAILFLQALCLWVISKDKQEE